MKVTDAPIWRPEDDLLDRDSLAALIADEIAALDHSAGGVLAITGPWGVGKTSLIKLVQSHLDKAMRVRTVWFNPWLFSGTNELVERFFQELSAQLGKGDKKLKKVASGMASYGKALTPLHRLPVLGGTAEAVTGTLAFVDEVIKTREGSIAKRQEALKAEMNGLDTTILIVIDDIDRLEPSEIREIFKLVRLTSDFPHILFLLAFDRRRVEEAFVQNDPSGRHYIEKIVYIMHEVPDVPKTVLRDRVAEGLGAMLKGRSLANPLDADRFGVAYSRIIEPNIKTIRDVKRFIASIGVTLNALLSSVDAVDLISMEAIRLFKPDLLRNIAQRSTHIAWTKSDINPFDTQRVVRTKNAVGEILGREEDQDGMAEATLEILFPLAWHAYSRDGKDDSEIGAYLTARRVAHRDIFDLYLNRFEGPHLLAMRSAEQVFEFASDREHLEMLFGQIADINLSAVISALEQLAENLPEEAAVPISTVVLNGLSRVPDEQRRFRIWGPVQAARRITFLVLVNSRSELRNAIVEEIYSGLCRFQERRTLIEVADNETMSGDRVVSSAFVAELKRRIAEDFRSAASATLSQEPHLLWLAKWVRDGVDGVDSFPELLNHPENAASLLRNSIVEQLHAVPGSDPRIMDVDSVVEVLGDIATLDHMMEICQELGKDDPSIEALLPIACMSIHAYRQELGGSEGIVTGQVSSVAEEAIEQS